ncbi:MAG: hypothetical protein JWN40_4847, partial [Phycisphaerales bacterium]|nr:hypothetical protein [Phycisphaerales bacterium]
MTKRTLHRSMRLAPVWAFAAVTAFWAASAQAQVLSQVPADSAIIFKINKLGAVSDKAGALAKQFGLVEMNPAAADPLGWLLSEGGMTNGLDKAGDAAVVFASADFGAQPPPLLILLPVSDYKAFIGNFADAKKEGELDAFHMKGEQDEMTYAANWGKYAAISPQKELLAKKPEGFKASGATAKELESKDAVIVVNLKVLGPKLDEQVKGHKDQILGDLEKNLGNEPKFGKYIPLLKVVVGQALNVADQVLSVAQYSSFSVNLGKDGVGTSFMLDFKDGTNWGKAIAGVKNTDSPLMTGLPDGKYIFFGGGINGWQSEQQLMEEWLKPIEAELAKMEDMKPALTILDSMRQMFKAQKSQAGGMLAPSGALGATSLFQMVVATTGDAKVMQEAQQKVQEAQQQLMALIPNQPKMTTTFTPNAKTVDGVAFTQSTTTLPA